jgi:hypothetical protein
MLALVLMPGGFIFAEEQPLLPGQTIEVSGSLDLVEWIQSDPSTWYFDEDMNIITPNDVQIWNLHGDMEGIIVINSDYIIPFPDWLYVGGGPFYYEGNASFTGYVLGKKTAWTAGVTVRAISPVMVYLRVTKSMFRQSQAPLYLCPICAEILPRPVITRRGNIPIRVSSISKYTKISRLWPTSARLHN